MIKVVTATEMARIEKLSGSSEYFMEQAARSLAAITAEYLEEEQIFPHVTLLVGKGNNGGDAYATGALLLQAGISVTAWQIYPLSSCSPLCKAMHDQFVLAGGIVHIQTEPKEFHFAPQGVILDGLVGTGFHGKAEGMLAHAIAVANASKCPILAIDIPSGVSGDTGKVETLAIHATQTLFLELPKIGFFINQGWEHVGKLVAAPFGLYESQIAEAKAVAYLPSNPSLPKVSRTRHKYQAGYVLAVAGSPEMPGAAILSSFAALRAGSGIVRLFHAPKMEIALSSAPYELIREPYSERRIAEESLRAKALLIGPGLGRSLDAKKKIQTLLAKTSLPTVVDADALYFLAKHPKWKLPKRTILTPHHGEMEMLLEDSARSLLDRVQAYVDLKKVTLVLKGAPTFLFTPGELPEILPHGDPGMATAGTGDVLTGMIAAFLAAGLSEKRAARLAATLHGLAGEAAARALTSYCMTASDLFDFFPEAFAHLES
ncbi:MAG: NAD(P)H-hydrate dehydratase [Verrucomicrobia bacterium]|nr:NAD(P)H-hydrate dehydratase [Verrucomicrobiota bacterium]